MSSLGSAIGGLGDLISGSKANYSLVDLTKNKGIQKDISGLTSNYGDVSSQDSTDLNTYIKNYLAGNQTAATDASQETNAVDRYYNGDVERQLAELRAQQSTLGDQAVSRAVALNTGNINRSLVGGGGGGDNSYAERIGIGTAADLDLNNQIQLLNQQRSDINQVNQGQIDLAGRRTSIADALAGRALTPIQARQTNLQSNTSMLGGIANVNNANNMFGAQYNPTMWDQIGSVTGDLGNAALQAFSIYSGMNGGGTSTGTSGYGSDAQQEESAGNYASGDLLDGFGGNSYNQNEMNSPLGTTFI